MNFIIIGGDAAGMSAASKAKRQRPEIGGHGFGTV